MKTLKMPSLSGIKKKYVISAIFLVFTLSIFNFAPSFALDGAKWSDDSKNAIIYDGKTFSKASQTDKSSLPENMRNKEVFIEKTALSSGGKKAQAIILDKIEDKIDGKIATFDVSALGNVKQNGDSQDISIDGVAEPQDKTSCAVEGGSGWVVCTLSTTIAGAMDGLYNILQDFLKVQPLKFGQRDGLFQVWSYMRNIANIIFAIIFIVVIYSQITNVGISNYGIKKILPKLIIAAILINVSYYVCAILVDFSNIIGAQLQTALNEIRKQISSAGVNINTNFDWKSLTAAVLAGGSVIAYAGYSFAMAGGVNVIPLLLLGALLTVLYSVFVAVVVLAARQAIITVMIFLSPLAFAAKILPNTEKWYNKWKDLFTTMLVMYPLISLLFGGSQLAGFTIIANANGNLITLILGMVVQLVPLAITPTIMKLSGRLLGSIAGMINDPNKGPVDSAKNYLKGEQDRIRDRKIAKGGNITSFLQRQSYERSRRRQSAKNIAENYQRRMAAQKDYESYQKAMKAKTAEQRDKILSKNISFQEDLSKLSLENAEEMLNSSKSALKAETLRYPLKLNINGEVVGIDDSKLKNLTSSLGKSSAQLYNVLNDINAHKLSDKNNKAVISGSIADNFTHSSRSQKISEGVRGDAGRNIALASAFSESQKVKEEESKALTSMVKSMNLNNKDLEDIVKTSKDFVKNGVTLKNNDTLKSAVMSDFITKNGINETVWAAEETAAGGSLHNIRTKVIEEIQNSKKGDLQWLSGGMANKIATEGMASGEFTKELIAQFGKKISDESIMSASDDTIELIFNNINSLSDGTIKSALQSFKSINEDSRKYGKVKANQGAQIHKAIAKIKANDQGLYDSIINDPSYNFDNIKK